LAWVNCQRGVRATTCGTTRATGPSSGTAPAPIHPFFKTADLPTGRILAVQQPRRVLAPGSTMKLLTAITAVRRVARFPRHRLTQREAAMICSCAGLVAGRRYARTDLLAGLLIPSGNDAAEAFAGSDPAR